jgi:hypothetical protein
MPPAVLLADTQFLDVPGRDIQAAAHLDTQAIPFPKL